MSAPPSTTAWPSPSSSTSPSASASAAAPTDNPYYLLYLGIEATIPFALRNLAVQVALSSVVFTLYAVLLFITNSKQRTSWTFSLATVVFGLFFATAFTNSIQLAHALKNPGKKVEMGIEYGDVVITLCLPWIGDWLIWLRMISLWPVEVRRRPTYLVMFGVPVGIKLFRFGILAALLEKLYHQMADSMSAADLGSKVWPLSWLTWAEYGAMLIDVSICSGICIARLSALMTPSHSERRSIALQTRLQLLLKNTISSFILPVISAVVMIILGAKGTFAAYGTMTKVNAGVTAINVLIAIIIPILQQSSVEEKIRGSQADQANSFIRNRMRSRGSQNTHPRSPAGSKHLRQGTAGIIQTTLEESFVDHVAYNRTKPYSPGSMSEKRSPTDAHFDLGDDMEMNSQQHSPVASGMSGFGEASIRPGHASSNELDRGDGGGGGGEADLAGATATTLPLRDGEDDHDPYRQPMVGVEAMHAVSDESTRDVLRTMPRISRFGQ
ncbi:hypothetical protein OC846_003553 [Tilletia horrida]|uniref:Uncharacterized protein n=1 Tax=Tilletia horrida TaxID=155126 RepID=A0AAN6GSB4_9BASI|nr:hypothetical protein OC846_003553 [Tilletia horrida]KAK0565934.1 hypothetical protein OC861_003522 [Tilletia horrida]